MAIKKTKDEYASAMKAAQKGKNSLNMGGGGGAGKRRSTSKRVAEKVTKKLFRAPAKKLKKGAKGGSRKRAAK
jgi:PHP family Zn ribbon phosphoesterase